MTSLPSMLSDAGITLPVLIELTVKGSLLLGAALLADRALRPASAAARHALWLLTFAALLALPFLGRGVGPLQLTLHWPSPRGAEAVAAASPAIGEYVRPRSAGDCRFNDYLAWRA